MGDKEFGMRDSTEVAEYRSGGKGLLLRRGLRVFLLSNYPLLRCFLAFYAASLLLCYLLLTFVAELWNIKLSELLFSQKDLPGLGYALSGMVIVMGYIGYYAFSRLWRKPLLLRHRLYLLSGNIRSGTGFLDIALPGVASLAVALSILGMVCRAKSSCGPVASILILVLMMVCAFMVAIWLSHLVDYSRVSAALSGMQTSALANTIQWLEGAAKERLAKRKEFVNELYEGMTAVDDLPDREISPEILEALLQRLRGQLAQLEEATFHGNFGKPEDETLTFGALRERYGYVVCLFHPDYLPHMAHVYIKISQLRALNMAPRRIQLLGRRWTARGLESEYVVVHDISELRQEQSEWPEMEAKIERVVNLWRLYDPDPEGDENRAATLRKYIETIMIDLAGSVRETKWRQRSLKKRAIVSVAPDGSLLGISIEEERQFNI